MNIGLIGGGSVGTALARLFKSAGHHTLIGSRTPTDGKVSYLEACSRSELIVLAVPFAAVEDILPELRAAIGDKIVVDATNPLQDDWSPLLLGQDSSAGEVVRSLLPDASVVKAFNTIFVDVMTRDGFARGGAPATAFIAGDDPDAVALVADLAEEIGLAPRTTGPLASARYLEAMAHLNIAIALGQQGGTGGAFVYSEG